MLVTTPGPLIVLEETEETYSGGKLQVYYFLVLLDVNGLSKNSSYDSNQTAKNTNVLINVIRW